MKAVSLKIYHFSKWLLLVFLICIALLSVVGRALLNNVEHFKNEIEQEFADYGINGVALENIEGRWAGLQPLLKIQGASLSIPGRSDALSVNELEFRVKLIPSLLSGDLILESFHSSIDKLVLVRDVEGAWWLNDILLTTRSDDESRLDIYGFFQRLPSFVNIDIDLIRLRDLRHGADYLIQKTTLRSSRKKQQLSLELLAQLPTSLGRKIHLQLEGDELNQQLHVNVSRLDLKQMLQLTVVEKTGLEKAILSFQSWISLEKFRFKEIITEATVSQVQIKNKLKERSALSFSVQQKATVDSDRWLVNTEISNITRSGQLFPEINSQLLLSTTGANPRLWVDQVDLSLVSAMYQEVQSDDSVLLLLDGIQPDAIIDNVVAELDIKKPLQSIFGFDFTQVNTRVYRSIPGLKGLDGSLISSHGRARLNIDAQQVSMDFADLFRAPLHFNTLTANALININDSGVLVDSKHFTVANSDLSVQGRLWLEAPKKGRPFLSLRADYKDGRVTAVPKYLPVKIMPAKVVEWLDKSIQGGKIKQGDFLYHGRLKNPSALNKNQSGIMHASINLLDPKVDYLDGWPVVGQGEGQLDFINAGMNLDISRVQFVDVNVDKVNVNIPDFLKANLWVKAKTQSSAENLLSTLSQLPVLNVINEVKQKTSSISGQIASEVTLDIPLSRKLKKKIKVTAKADLQAVALSIPEWMIDFKQMKGVVEIENEKVSASALSGKYEDDDIQLSINPEVEAKRTEFHLTGVVHSQALLKLMPEYLKEPVSGVSPWNVSVSLGHKPTTKTPLLEIQAKSSLAGTELGFPQPLSVSKAEKQDFIFNAELFNKGDFIFDTTLKNRLAASGKLNLAKSSSNKLDYLKLQLGGDKSSLENEGISLAGNIKQLNIFDWFGYRKKYFPAEVDESSPFLQQVKSVDLNIDQLIVGKQQTPGSKIKIYNNGDRLQGSIDSALTKGTFEWPYIMGLEQPFVADLEYIKLKKSESTEKYEIDINDMPDLFINSKAVSYEDMEFHNLILRTRKEPDKFMIKQLDFSRDQVQLKSSGHWQLEAKSKEHVSVFNIDIRGSNFGQTVNNLGLGETIKGGEVEFNGQIGWGGELYSINWESLIGEVNLKLEDGYLKNVDPGAGRFVGLLSLNALPKRLFLDFGDVVKEGMQFNTINGKFSINGEKLTTDNASMDSVSAKVRIKGTTDLRHKTYDQTMTIIPKIGDTLPILGTLAAGTTVGWGLLLLQKILKKPIDKSVEIEYKVTGSWDNPQINLISSPNVDQQSDSINEPDF